MGYGFCRALRPRCSRARLLKFVLDISQMALLRIYSTDEFYNLFNPSDVVCDHRPSGDQYHRYTNAVQLLRYETTNALISLNNPSGLVHLSPGLSTGDEVYVYAKTLMQLKHIPDGYNVKFLMLGDMIDPERLTTHLEAYPEIEYLVVALHQDWIVPRRIRYLTIYTRSRSLAIDTSAVVDTLEYMHGEYDNELSYEEDRYNEGLDNIAEHTGWSVVPNNLKYLYEKGYSWRWLNHEELFERLEYLRMTTNGRIRMGSTIDNPLFKYRNLRSLDISMTFGDMDLSTFQKLEYLRVRDAIYDGESSFKIVLPDATRAADISVSYYGSRDCLPVDIDVNHVSLYIYNAGRTPICLEEVSGTFDVLSLPLDATTVSSAFDVLGSDSFNNIEWTLSSTTPLLTDPDLLEEYHEDLTLLSMYRYVSTLGDYSDALLTVAKLIQYYRDIEDEYKVGQYVELFKVLHRLTIGGIRKMTMEDSEL